MKKFYLMMAAVSALALTACTSEDDFVQDAPTTQVAADQAVGFDVYLPNTNSTRAGRAGVMTTGALQMTGFGVFGYQSDGEHSNGSYAATAVPNFMWNQQISYNNTNSGWYYAPLKYWPNETLNDSQTSTAQMPDISTHDNLDRITLFAYAPWVSAVGGTGVASPINEGIEAPAAEGITMITANDGKFNSSATVVNPKVRYVVNKSNANKSVDLLWGVAPVGGLNYTAVNKTSMNIVEGMPLIDLVKPAVNTNMQFLFQHALARLGFKVVLAADQVAAGGNFDYGSTKVTIEEIDIEGKFGIAGTLNLKNTVRNVANWEDVTAAESTNKLVISGNALAAHLRYDATKNTSESHLQQVVTGVTTSYSDVLQVSSISDALYHKYSTEVDAPAYSPTTPYFANWTANATPTYAPYSAWAKTANTKYFYKTTMNTEQVAYTDITSTINVTYPEATVWTNIVSTPDANVKEVVSTGASATQIDLAAAAVVANVPKTYRKVGDTYVPTGQMAEVGDYIFDGTISDVAAPTLTAGTKKYLAVPNYFMVIPTNWDTTEGEAYQKALKTIKVKIKYWVSTKDTNLKDGIVYTKNEVEKEITLPHLKNGSAYNIKMILGMTSVKLEAEVADWTTTGAEINLPQNTAE